MPRIEGTYPSPVHGVSTVKPRGRQQVYAEAQDNFRSDTVDKLTRRPSLVWEGKLFDVLAPFAYHKYTRGEDSFRIIVVHDNAVPGTNVFIFKNRVRITDFDSTKFPVLESEVADMKFMTIKDRTYLLNTHTIPDFTTFTYEHPTLGPTTEYDVEDHPIAGTELNRVSHVNVTVAAEYGETFELNVTSSLGTVNVVLEIPVYNPDQDPTDTLSKRSTTQIAKNLVERLDALGSEGLGIFAVAKGSSVAIWEAEADGDGVVPNGRALYDWLEVEVSTGQGDRSLVAINQRIEKVDGLPLYAIPGTRIIVRPNPRSDDGIYYLQAEAVAYDFTNGDHRRIMKEVIWVEQRNPYEPHSMNPATLPYAVDIESDDSAKLAQVSWKARRTGDDESCPPPTFLSDNKVITDMSYFQNRLVFLSDDEVHMTETDDLDNWWKASAIQLLVTDPIGISSSAENVDKLEQAVPHNRDLLVLAQNGQFKIDGKTAVTPQTVSMQLTTDYEVQTNPQPVAIGNSAYLPMVFGSSAGLHEYTGQENTSQDTAYNIATHVRGYMAGGVDKLVASPNLEMIAMTTTETAGNILFVYQQFTQKNGQIAQGSWSRWILPEDVTIHSMYMVNDELELMTAIGDELHIQSITMHEHENTDVAVVGEGDPDVFLDHRIVLPTNGIQCLVPADYPWSDDMVIVAGVGTNYPRTLVEYSKAGSIITFMEDIGAGDVEVGLRFTSSYIPTRPYKRDQDGAVITTDRIRVAKLRVSVVESYELYMHIISDYYDGEDQAFNSRVMNANNNLVGFEPFTTDEVQFGFSQDVKYAQAELYTDGFLALTIDGITWEGQYYQSSRRM